MPKPVTVTRRGLLGGMAKLGGAGAVYETLAVWDFLQAPPALAASLALPKESGAGKTVAILGAGVSGLCAAYELDRAGYDVVILEAQRRAGGRSLTLRRGDVFQELSQPAQTCEFDDGLYLNAGPGRIPHHHVNYIDYCRRFGVAMQPYIFASRANLVHSSTLGNGRTVPVREALYSLQGHVAELLDKCTRKPDLDLPVTGADLEKFQDMLVEFGGLTKTPRGYSYQNQAGRAGVERPAGVATPMKPLSPMRLEEILRSRVWDDWIFRDADLYWQTSLMEPVGGMDQFAKGFMRREPDPLDRRRHAVSSGGRSLAAGSLNDGLPRACARTPPRGTSWPLRRLKGISAPPLAPESAPCRCVSAACSSSRSVTPPPPRCGRNPSPSSAGASGWCGSDSGRNTTWRAGGRTAHICASPSWDRSREATRPSTGTRL